MEAGKNSRAVLWMVLLLCAAAAAQSGPGAGSGGNQDNGSNNEAMGPSGPRATTTPSSEGTSYLTRFVNFLLDIVISILNFKIKFLNCIVDWIQKCFGNHEVARSMTDGLLSLQESTDRSAETVVNAKKASREYNVKLVSRDVMKYWYGHGQVSAILWISASAKGQFEN